MNIVYITDDNFAQHTGISMLSLLEHNKHIDDINIYIGDNGIKDVNINRLRKIASRYSRNIYFARAEECLEKNLDEITKKKVLDYYGTLVGCLQFMMDKIFPELDEIFYLDSDTIIEGALDDVLSVDMNEKLIAAVASPGTLISMSESELELAKSREVYYNTGVMIINLKKWREGQIFDRVVEDFSKNKKYAFGAQSIINNVISDKEMIKLHVKFNYWGFQYSSVLRKKIFLLGEYYNREQVELAISNPVIVHFKGYERPWFKEFTKNYYAKRYLMYKNMTGDECWKNIPLMSYYRDVYLKRNHNKKFVRIKYFLGTMYRKIYEKRIRTMLCLLRSK